MKRVSFTFDQCKKKSLKYSNRTNWCLGHPSSFYQAKYHKWLDEIKPKIQFTIEDAIREAKKFKTRKEWQKKGGASYYKAFKRNWLDICCEHMKNCGGVSLMEKELFEAINKKYPTAQANKWFGSNPKGTYGNRFQLDIYIPELNKGIEFNGTYWHSKQGISATRLNWKMEDLNNYHKIKKNFFKSRNIDYIEITEKEWIKSIDNCLKQCDNFLKGT